MSYNFKRAIGISFLLYVATFVVGIISGVVSNQDMSSINTISDSFWYVGMVAAVILTALFTAWYYKNTSITPSVKSGLFFGLTTVFISFILDFSIFSLGNSQGANVNLWDYYGDSRFWIIIILVLATAKSVGFIKSRTIS